MKADDEIINLKEKLYSDAAGIPIGMALSDYVAIRLWREAEKGDEDHVIHTDKQMQKIIKEAEQRGFEKGHKKALGELNAR